MSWWFKRSVIWGTLLRRLVGSECLVALGAVLLLGPMEESVRCEEFSALGSSVLEVPVHAMPLEAIVPLSQEILEGAAMGQTWQLVPMGPGPIDGSIPTTRQENRPVPAQRVPGVKPDGQAAETYPQLAIQILQEPPKPPPEGKTSPPAKSPSAGSPADRLFRYRLQSVPEAIPAAFQWKDVSPASVGLWEGQRPVLVYNHGPITKETIPVKDHRRTRACYVSPLYGLRGEILTDDFPQDHYHHHGIFWTWPHLVIEGQEHDLWAGSTIRQQFVRWLARQTGPVCAVLGVENGWYVASKKVMIERIWFWVYRAADGKHRSIDIALYLEPTEHPVTLWGAPEKSYGGLTVRFAPSSRTETEITVPSGRTTEDLLNTRLRWADFTSKMLGADFRSGAAILIHPQHPDYPPTWLTRHYGAMCVGWPGVRPKTLLPGKPVRLSYRLWIHREPVSVEELAAAYEAFCVGAESLRWTAEK